MLNPLDVTPSIAFMRRKKMNKNVYDDNIQINNEIEYGKKGSTNINKR
jgi:hypothetical protein